MNGITGNQMRIYLDRRDSTIEPVPETIARQFLGGAGYGAKLLYDELPAGIDPLGPENKLLLATGPLSLNQVPGGGSLMLCFKSPLTQVWGESRVGGNFGPEMKRAGLDYIVLEGKASEPVYLVIRDHTVEFRPASHLLGMKVSEKMEAIHKEVGEKKASIICIGPAGENLVRIASVMDGDRAAGRGGPGAVMGSKNLIAVAIKGYQKTAAINPDQFIQSVRKTNTDVKKNPFYVGFQSFGTIGDIPSNDDGGDWPTKNWQSNSWGKGPELYDHYEKENFIKGYGCYQGCLIGCARLANVKDGLFKTPPHGGAEYESVSCFTAYVMNTDMDAAIHSTYLCNEYGLDTISTGAMIAFAMECYEKGLFDERDVQELDLNWGNAAVLPVMVRMIAERQGIGNILAEGVRLAAKTIGQGAAEFAIHVKGMEGPAHDPRSGKALAVTYGTANRGMCHIHPLEGMAWDRGKVDWGLVKYGVRDPNDVERWEETGKGYDVKILQDGLSLPDILGTCKFYMYAGVTLDHWAELISAFTGWDIDGKELLKVGERAINIQRMFNIREGLTAKDDRVPARVINKPTFGKYSTEDNCATRDFEKLLMEYYEARGWDPVTGEPYDEKKQELGLV